MIKSDALIIFDCDGVLIDSEPIASCTLALALQDAGVAITPEESLRVFTGNSEPHIRRICAEQYGLEDVEGTFEKWHIALREAFATQLRPMAGMLELVAGLAQPNCVASNSRISRLEQSLGITPLWTHFAPHIYSAEMVALPKPAPDLLIHCALRMDVAPSTCVMIDDSPHGIAAAKAAGMASIGFVDPNDPRPARREVLAASGADFVVHGAWELAALLSA